MPNTLEISCISLDSPRWGELVHAYGQASDVPELLRRVANVPTSANEQEPWFSLWSALAHQNDVYSASFAAVPHVVRVLATSPMTADSSYFQFPAVVETCRQQKGVQIPDDLQADYFAALAALPTLVAQAADREWDSGFLVGADRKLSHF